MLTTNEVSLFPLTTWFLFIFAYQFRGLSIILNKVNQQHLRIEWFPTYAQLGEALETYGYRFECSLKPGFVHNGKLL